MNLTDLNEVLRDHAILPDSAHEARMAGVRARVAATRRRRAAAGVACAVLALVGIVYTLLPHADPPPEPALPTRSMPEYQFGTRLIAQAWQDLPATSVTVHFVPKSLDLMVFTQCDTGQQENLLINVAVNGREFKTANSCGHGTSTDWADLGVVPGQPSVATLTILGKQGDNEPGQHPSILPLPATGVFALGVAEAVPVHEYPFPPRPETLPTIQPGYPYGIQVRANELDPAARQDTTVEWHGPTRLHAEMNTPGRIRVLVNDIEVLDYSNWSYIVGGTEVDPERLNRIIGLPLAKGQQVKVTVIPERATGDWKVTLEPR